MANSNLGVFMFANYRFFIFNSYVPNCSFCGGSNTIDNGDGFYCRDCNVVFENF